MGYYVIFKKNEDSIPKPAPYPSLLRESLNFLDDGVEALQMEAENRFPPILSTYHFYVEEIKRILRQGIQPLSTQRN